MGISIDSDKTRMRELVCKKYIAANSKGKLIFKSYLNNAIMQGTISEDDALLITLELMYGIRNYDFNYNNVLNELKKLILKVNEYNDYNPSLKNSVIFFKDYSYEKEVLSEYVGQISPGSRLSFDKRKSQKNKSNDIKKCFDHLSRDDLCYILDINPELTFDKEKILKKRICDKFSDYNYDLDKLDGASTNDIKKYLETLVNESNENRPIENQSISNMSIDIKLTENQSNDNQFNGTQLNKLSAEIRQKMHKDAENRKIQAKIRMDRNKHIFQQNKQKINRNQKYIKPNHIKKVEINYLKVKHDKNDFNNIPRNNIENKSSQRIYGLKLENILKKVKLFNSKNFLEMVLLKDEYSKIHDEILNDYANLSQYGEIVKFKNYFLHFDEIKLINKILDGIRNNYDSNQFENDLRNNGFLNFEKREKILNQYKPTYELLSKINSFPNFLIKKFYLDFKDLYYFKQYYKDLIDYKNLNHNKSNVIKDLNEKILDDEIKDNEEFFEGISDINKRRAIVIDERNVKVNAGAGTGKTFTIQKKVNYLIEKKRISPKKILCLCYTVKGARDLDDKVNFGRDEYNKVEACTFHEFCRRVAISCGINKGRTNRKLLNGVVRNYSKGLIDDEKLDRLIEYFSYYINSPVDEDSYDTYEELLIFERGRDLKTLKKKYYEAGVTTQTMQGEIVESIGELMIANYLFMHDIEYVYEDAYKSNLIDIIQNHFLYSGNYSSLINLESKKVWIDNFIIEQESWDYFPDFYLPEYDIYLEHFGIGRSNNEKWLGEDYENQIIRKINFHKLHQTKLIKTFYYDLAEGRLINELERLLKKNKVKIGQKNRKNLLDILETTNKIQDFENFNKLIISFINIFEAQNNRKTQFDLFKKINESENDGYKRNRQKLFLDIVSDIYDIYYELNEGERIDNNREVSLALELIQNGQYSGSYDYILIDEYQDINSIRLLLLQSLQKVTDANLFVVGDDWQSIYKFSGSDLNLFIDFDKYFPNSESINLKENRRNYDKINRVACKFIRENKKQEKKKLKSIKRDKPNSNPIKIIMYDLNPKSNKVLKLYSIIIRIINNNPKKDQTKILLLGRNNEDIDKFTNNNTIFKSFPYNDKVTCLKKPELNITFMTIHKSKGLEYDEVVILNFKDELNGFPNKMEDDSVLHFLKDKEEFPHAEERRLLYVALTRTLNNVYLLVPTYGESVFIEELVNNHGIKRLRLPIDKKLEKNFYKLSKSDKPFDCRKTDIDCPNCDDGKITVVRNNKSGTQYIRCSNHPVPDPSHYSGGPYWGDLENYIYIEKCPNPNCEGVLIRDYDRDMLVCTFNRKGCKETKKIKNFNDYFKRYDSCNSN